MNGSLDAPELIQRLDVLNGHLERLLVALTEPQRERAKALEDQKLYEKFRCAVADDPRFPGLWDRILAMPYCSHGVARCVLESQDVAAVAHYVVGHPDLLRKLNQLASEALTVEFQSIEKRVSMLGKRAP